LELIELLGYRRLERELRCREAALREAAQAPKAPELKPLLAPYASARQVRWECDFCGRRYHGYGSYLNHRCDSDDGAAQA
jgi:hypothetical protein